MMSKVDLNTAVLDLFTQTHELETNFIIYYYIII